MRSKINKKHQQGRIRTYIGEHILGLQLSGAGLVKRPNLTAEAGSQPPRHQHGNVDQLDRRSTTREMHACAYI
jgi:hypothetical protein